MVGTHETALGAGDHVVQFYECDSDLARSVAAYVAGAVRGGGAAVVIASEDHQRAFEARLTAAGVDLVEALTDLRLVRLDAAATLEKFTSEARIDAEAFHRVIGSAIRAAGGQGRTVRAYGEMVAILWDAGDVAGAIELERLWNDLVAEHQCSLLCAYRSSSVRGPGYARALGRVCRLHSRVLRAPASEPMQVRHGSSARIAVRAEFLAQREAPREARRFLTDALRQRRCDGTLAANAQLVLSELATNAVVHARSRFSVGIRCTTRGVLLSVADASPAPPAILAQGSPLESGCGLRLVAALASDWGTEFTARGKTVWAELTAPSLPHRNSTISRPNTPGRLPDRRPRPPATIAGPTTVRVLDADPDLAAGMDQEQREQVSPLAVAPVTEHRPGPWRFVPEPDPATAGVLVLDGLILIRVAAGTHAHVELLGPGDLTSPWVGMAPDLSVPSTITATVLSTAQIALLDRGFIERTARWPELHAALTQRAIARSRNVSLQAAVNALPRIDQRLELTLWQLADRIGQVTRHGITLHLPITHSQLAEMVAARRPTVTTALSQLQQQGHIIRTSPNHWLLRGPAPAKRSPLNQHSRL